MDALLGEIDAVAAGDEDDLAQLAVVLANKPTVQDDEGNGDSGAESATPMILMPDQAPKKVSCDS